MKEGGDPFVGDGLFLTFSVFRSSGLGAASVRTIQTNVPIIYHTNYVIFDKTFFSDKPKKMNFQIK